ncbi:hypothetical protein EV426DRAFT_605364 [Tirmania nivea]|nr:hypothetical protein EV426DRAFT_605364 [Tirmania nivea]
MHFSTLLVAATTFAMTWGTPVGLVPRQQSPPPSQNTQNVCAQQQTFSCCNQVQNNSPTSILGPGGLFTINLNLAFNCLVLINSCNSDQQAVCCNGISSTAQAGDAVAQCVF